MPGPSCRRSSPLVGQATKATIAPSGADQSDMSDVASLTAELETVEFTGDLELDDQLAAAARIERAATALGATELAMHARLVHADLRYSAGDLDAVGETTQIHQWALTHQALAVLAGSHSLLQR